jgi:RNA polymerase sigma-70 factor (ECF subfamily)
MVRVGHGDALACRTLVARHLPRIVGFAGRLLGDHTEAEDVAQEVFMRVWTHAAGWRPEARLTTWLHRVAINLCADRRKGRHAVPPAPLDAVAEPVDPAPAAVDVLHTQELGVRVRDELLALPEEQRRAIVLCHYQGFRNREAAEIMETSVEAVESLLARGRRRLRARLEGFAPALLGDG